MKCFQDLRNKCINCGKDSGCRWFCESCTAIKESAYKECRELGINNWFDVIKHRDKKLNEIHTKVGTVISIKKKKTK